MSITTLDALRRGELAGARTLTLRAGLTEFPREILGLADTLEVLDLSSNALDSLPDDICRLRHLRVLFCSGNRFLRLPPSLGACTALSQVGFRGSGVQEVPGESLPPALRWLTLTDNRIETLPTAIGERPLLQKLMLSGNRLRELPGSLAGAAGLELLRLSANRFDALPPWLAGLPRLAWLAWAGNPLDQEQEIPATSKPGFPTPGPVTMNWTDLQLGALLGEGASGRVHQALWQPAGGAAPLPVAVKLFKNAMTSDGLPEREMAASLAAGDHPNLVGALGRLAGHPGKAEGLVMKLLPAHWQVLAGPPSFESCSRDVYDPGSSFSPDAVRHLAGGIGAAAAHLHARGLLHGDLYAHNILWDATTGEGMLSDFGGASFLPEGDFGMALQRIEMRAWGLLLGELLDRCAADSPGAPALAELQLQCVQPVPSARPLMADALDMLDGLV